MANAISLGKGIERTARASTRGRTLDREAPAVLTESDADSKHRNIPASSTAEVVIRIVKA